ncbi:MAG TPA: hypothetical protein PKJ26_04315 [Candidatus Woesebacteria bacterium]|nr:hypothetical protein [Candidatus Woesebacteria bacterium]
MAKISFNFSLLIKELRNRGCKIKTIVPTLIFRASYLTHHELLFDTAMPSSSFTSAWIAGDKYLTKKTLKKAGIRTPVGKTFLVSNNICETLKAYANKIGYPIVIKPTQLGQGTDVYSQIYSELELQEALNHYLSSNLHRYVLIEKYIVGNEYRLFITNQGFFAVVNRIPANITGDGSHTIDELIAIENDHRMHPRSTCLCTIKVDTRVNQFLKKQNLNLQSIPNRNTTIQLRLNSNVSLGGDCIDVTDKVHNSFKTLAKKILEAFGDISVLGIDIICADISQPLKKQAYSICEVNPLPGLSLHTLPSQGNFQDTPAAFASILFPELPAK